MKLSALVIALGMAFSGSAFAATAVWDTAAPWGSATTTQYAEWNVFNGTSDNSPEVSLSAETTASVTENTGLAFLTGGNIYSWQAPTSFTANLSGSGATGGLFDVYLRIGTLGSVANVTATLNGVSAAATSVQTIGETTIVMGGVSAEQEVYWKWAGVSSASLYTFNFSASSSSMSLDQLALATVAVTAVPEPETYSMMALGLGLMAFVARRSRKNQA
ncbi:PEP-CTERM sorting domain-containing protein [Methylophilus luteus]|uniref:PEP-CTERM sorting domain-containing protein n=1 Tax=Methylophilus luteus TaxID=640108 RepID=A0ABW3F8G8_9PROT